MPNNCLSITAPPFKSSRLAIPPSPFSSQFPITPPVSPLTPQTGTQADIRLFQQQRSHLLKGNRFVEPPPSEPPLAWTWRCCKCRQSYRLGVTRRCFNEGHHFCSGETVYKTNHRTRRRDRVKVACDSEFDYQGWKVWSAWRRRVQERLEESERSGMRDGGGTCGAVRPAVTVPSPMFVPTSSLVSPRSTDSIEEERNVGTSTRQAKGKRCQKDCWNQCDYPSECRWGKRYGARTPTLSHPPQATFPMAPGTSPTQSPVPIMKQENGPTFDDILLRLSTNSVSATPLGNTGSAHQQQTNMGEDTVSPTEIAKPNVEDLAHCTERRRRRSSGLIPSPLASHLPADLYHSSPGNPDRMEVDEEFPSPDSAAAAPGQHSHMPASGYVRTSSVSESMIESLGKDIRKGFETLRGQLGIGPSKTYDQHLHRNYADQVHAVNMSEPMEDVRPTFTAATSLRGVKTSRRGQERS